MVDPIITRIDSIFIYGHTDDIQSYQWNMHLKQNGINIDYYLISDSDNADNNPTLFSLLNEDTRLYGYQGSKNKKFETLPVIVWREFDSANESTYLNYASTFDELQNSNLILLKNLITPGIDAPV